MGGGSAQINPHYRVTPLEALRDALPANVSLATNSAGTVASRALYAGRGRSRLFPTAAIRRAGGPQREERGGCLHVLRHGDADFPPNDFSARLRSDEYAEETGEVEFSLSRRGGRGS